MTNRVLCEHRYVEDERHENDDRIRTLEHCTECQTVRYGCYAKRLGIPESECHRSDGGELIGAWGVVGLWTYKIHEEHKQPVESGSGQA